MLPLCLLSAAKLTRLAGKGFLWERRTLDTFTMSEYYEGRVSEGLCYRRHKSVMRACEGRTVSHSF